MIILTDHDRNIKRTLIAAFADSTQTGNLALVHECSIEIDIEAMQQMAKDAGHPASVFLFQKNTGHYSVRWFSPSSEIKLCLHGALAAAHTVLCEDNLPQKGSINLSYPSGEIRASLENNRINLQLPRIPTTVMDIPVHSELLLNLEPIAFARAGSKHAGYQVFVVKSIEQLQQLTPNISNITQLTNDSIIVTAAKNDNTNDYQQRVFVPQYGVDEDQVTGSATLITAEYWHQVSGNKNFDVFQCSQRTGRLNVELVDETMIALSGVAIPLNVY